MVKDSAPTAGVSASREPEAGVGPALLQILCWIGLGAALLLGAGAASLWGIDLRLLLASALCCAGSLAAWYFLGRGAYAKAAWTWVVVYSMAMFVPSAIISARGPAPDGSSMDIVETVLWLLPLGAPVLVLAAGVLLPRFGPLGVVGLQLSSLLAASLSTQGSVSEIHWGSLVVSTAGAPLVWFVARSLTRQAVTAHASRSAALAAKSALQETNEKLKTAQSDRAALEALSERLQVMTERSEGWIHAMASASRLTASTLGERELTEEVVQVVERHLGLSAGLYLLEHDTSRAQLVAANRLAPQLLVGVGEWIEADEHTLIGKCFHGSRAYVVGDVRDGTTSAPHFAAGVQSEAAVPLMVRNDILGALAVASSEPEAFGSDDLVALGVLASAAASAIQNVRAVAEARRALRQLTRLQRRYVQEAWDRFAPQLGAAGYRYKDGEITSLGHRPLPEVSRAVAEGETHVEPGGRLVSPIALRGHVIGALGLDDPAGDGLWTPEDINLVESVARQMSVVLENARLSAATQRSLAEITELNRRYVRQAWEGFTLAGEPSQSVFAQPGIDRDGPLPGEIAEAVTLERPLSIARSEDGQPESALLAPINLRGELIGILGLEEKGITREWSEDELALIDGVASQMSWAIENARLLAESDRHAVELGQTARQLREVDQFRTQFLANMSHELRTPLNSIIGFSRVILKGIDGPLTELQKTDLEAIHTNGQHLLAMINEVLDMSKIEAGRMELIIEPVDLKGLIEGVIAASAALIQGRPIELRQEIEDGLPTIWADGTRIRQVITNLMSNAAKFTRQGSITFRVWSDDETVYVSVRDTGEGIPQDKVPLVFEPFRQVDGSPTRRAQGTGLGLPISSQFVEMHGGRIWLESEYGVGTTFTFCLPIEGPVEAVPELEGVEVDPERRLILLVADDANVLNEYRIKLQGQAYQLVGLYDDDKAVRWARLLRPWAVVLDCNTVSRLGVLGDLKSWRATRSTPVVACCSAGDGSRAINMGASAHLSKPFRASALLEVLARIQR